MKTDPWKPRLFEAIPNQPENPNSDSRTIEIREILWGNTLMQARQLHRPGSVRVGQAPGWKSRWFGKQDPDETEILRQDADGSYWLVFPAHAEGQVTVDEQTDTFQQLIEDRKAVRNGWAYRYRFRPGMKALFVFDALSYHLRFVNPMKMKPVPLSEKADWNLRGMQFMFLFAYVLLLLYFNTLPAPEVAGPLGPAKNREIDRFSQFLEIKPPEPEKKKPKPMVAALGAKHIGPEGRKGKEDSLLDKTQGRPRMGDREEVNTAGILGVKSVLDHFEKQFGGGMLDKFIGELKGPDVNDNQRGKHGFGTIGAGRGGNGTSLGLGDGAISMQGPGVDGNLFDTSTNLPKSPVKLDIPQDEINMRGALDKSVIQRLINGRLSQFRYCYQKELRKDPSLYGKVTIKFTIGGDGLVRASLVKISTIKNHAVESCVARTMKRIIFPPPKGGGIVVVTYPFVFKPSGE